MPAIEPPDGQLVFESAGEHVTARIPVAAATATVGSVRESLVGQQFESAAQVAVCEGDRLQANVVLAFFVPAVVYLADAVGTQTETLVIRGLSVGVPIGRVVRRELLTGLLVGLVLGAAFFPFVYWRWDRFDLALAVSLALACSCSIASGVAMSLPWVLHRLGTDPAFGAGPIATVIQDLLSVLIYFLICQALLPAS